MRVVLAAFLALAAAGAWGVEDTRWPPPEPIAARMRALEAAIRDPGSTPAQREAAREELGGLLKSPAGRAAAPAPRKAPARAAIDPYPSVVKPLPPLPAAAPREPGVAHLEVLPPPRPPAVDPRTGSVAAPSGRFAIDAATGHVLHEVPGGYVDPRTGRFIPR